MAFHAKLAGRARVEIPINNAIAQSFAQSFFTLGTFGLYPTNWIDQIEGISFNMF
jgi:hypothetical protein